MKTSSVYVTTSPISTTGSVVKRSTASRSHDENAIFVRPRPERCRNRRVRDDVDPTEHRARRARKYRFGKLEPFWIVEQGAPIEWSSWEACVPASVLNQHGPPTIVTY
jgi:hypothetical protein